jgi:nucleotide-binding universal stress UspA family protein
MPGTIIVGFDGSPASRAAADWAARRAQRCGCELRLVLSVPDDWGPTEAQLSTDGIEPAARALDEGRARVAALFPGITIHTAIRRGDPALVLGELSRDAVLVVVGTDKPADPHGEGFGAVGLQVVTRSACTVAIIPSTPTPPTRGTGVVVGVDGSADADRALRVAAGEAEMCGQALTIVHAVADAGQGRPTKPRNAPGEQGADEAGERVLDAAVAAVRDLNPRLQVHRVLDTRHSPAEALASAAGGARLLVVGSRGRESVKHMWPGAIGSVVLSRIACPMLVTTPSAADS